MRATHRSFATTVNQDTQALLEYAKSNMVVKFGNLEDEASRYGWFKRRHLEGQLLKNTSKDGKPEVHFLSGIKLP